MTRIFANQGQLLATGPNASFGNHLFHLLFAANLAHRHGLPLVISGDSNLDKVFDLARYKGTGNPRLIWEEEYGAVGRRGLEMQRRNLEGTLGFLRDKDLLPDGDIMFAGWFQHQSVVPPAADFAELLPLHPRLREAYLARFPDLLAPDAVGVHYRGTDFLGFGNVDRRLPYAYYRKAVRELELQFQERNLDSVSFHLFSDEPQVLIRYLMRALSGSRLKIRHLWVHQDSYHEDWLGLHFCTHLIGSNSSFCASASLYKTAVATQPRGMLNMRSRVPDPIDSYQKNALIIPY